MVVVVVLLVVVVAAPKANHFGSGGREIIANPLRSGAQTPVAFLSSKLPPNLSCNSSFRLPQTRT